MGARGRGGREGGGLVKNKKEMDFLIENGEMAAALLCCGVRGLFSERTRHRPIAVNGRAWARRKFKVGPPVCLSCAGVSPC